jgi:uncharacterized protein
MYEGEGANVEEESMSQLPAQGTVQTKAQVFSLLRQHQQELQRLGVDRCGVFGSFVKGVAIREESDVDILVAFDPARKTFDNFMSLAFFLEELFGRKVDLVTVESLSPYIGPYILEEVEYVSTNS